AWEEAYGVIAQVFIDSEKEMYEEAAEQPGGWDGFKDFVVVDKVKESDVITSFYLKPYDNNVIAEYETGQYLTIRVKIPNEEYKQIRHYTISASPGSDTFHISLRIETDITRIGKVSTNLNDLVNVGNTREASSSAGTFTLDDDKRTVTLMSGGVGITPMISML